MPNNLNFIKNNFKPDKITQKNILDFLIKQESSLQKMLDNANGDVLVELQNMRTIANINDKIPKINEKLYAELLDTITLDKKRPLNLIYDERLKKLTLTQEKIYKVLAKIEEDLIDEQDTSIKNKDKTESKFKDMSKLDLEKYIKDLVNKEFENYDANGTNVVGSILSGVLGAGALKYLYNKIKPSKEKINKLEEKKKIEDKKKIEEQKKKVDKKTNKKPEKKVSSKMEKFSSKIKKLKSFKKLSAKILTKAVALGLQPEIWILLELIDVFNKVANYWADVTKYIETRYWSPIDKLEEFIFAFCAGASEWLKENLELIEFLNELILEVFKSTREFIDCLENPVVKELLNIVSTIMPLGKLLGLISELIDKEIKKCLQTGLYGPECGIEVLNYWYSFSEIRAFDKFFDYMGMNPHLDNAKKQGYVKTGYFKSAKLVGTSTDIAKSYTTEELKQMIAQGDLSRETMNKVTMALTSKTKYTDFDVMKLRAVNNNLDPLINSLSINTTPFGKKWNEFAQLCYSQVKLHPSQCILEGHYLKEKFLTEIAPNIFSYDNKEESINEAKEFFNLLYKEILNSKINTKDIELWRTNPTYWLFFTVYGTVILSYKIRDVIGFEKLKKQYKMIKPKIANGSAVINKVIGHFDVSTMKLIPLFAQQNDIVFKEYFKNNIIVSQKQDYTTIGTTSSSVSSVSSNTTKQDINITPGVSQTPKIESTAKLGDVQSIVYDFLTNKMKLTKEQAAGVMGNIMQESSFNPKAHNKQGGGDGAFGLCQWRGERLRKLREFAKGRDINDPTVQMEYLLEELSTTEKRAFDALKKATTVEEASIAWSEKFERAGKGAENSKRIGYANSYYNAVSNATVQGNVATEATQVTPSTSGTPNVQTVQTPQNISGNGIEMAAGYARRYAHAKSQGRCARYVANALQAVGFKFQRQGSAYMYHTNGVLKKMGFNIVSNDYRGFKPQIGDVCVINRFGNHKHGHICIWDGRNWISDFIQRNASPYKDGAPNGAWIYRYGGTALEPIKEMQTDFNNYSEVENFNFDKPVQSFEQQKQQRQQVENPIVNINEKENTRLEQTKAEDLFYLKIENCV